jgi:cyclophilin family peptidyl-prolyl cis-trans isomerase
MKLYRFTLLSLVVVLVLALTAGAASAHPATLAPDRSAQDGARTPAEICADATANSAEPETREFEQAEDVLQDGVDYWAVMCTDAGPIYLDLYEDEAPITVNNFVFLAQQGYFNNTTFHRVLPGFMAQGGDPTGTGSGGPGYEFEDETDNGLVFDEVGLLAMANAGPDTNGSQFFITYALTSWLDGQHTIFGKVYQGLDAAELLMPRDPQQNPSFSGSALDAVVIIEDPSTVSATPDGPPTLDHFQALLERSVAGQINQAFSISEEFSHVYTLDEEAESYESDGGAELVDFLRGYLAEHGFLGTAAILMPITECPPNPADLPIWALGFQVSDYGAMDAAAAVVTDDTRSDTFVSTGAFEAYQDATESDGRVYSRAVPEGEWCGPDGTYYRLEMPMGRYLLTVDMIVDATIINDESEPTGEQYLGFVMQDLLVNSIGSTLERGTAAVSE